MWESEKGHRPSSPTLSPKSGEAHQRQLVWSDVIDFSHLPLLALGKPPDGPPGQVHTSGGRLVSNSSPPAKRNQKQGCGG